MTETDQLLLGRILEGQENLKEAVQSMERSSSNSRKQLHEKVEQIRADVSAQGHRLQNLEKAMSKAEPDLARFRAMEQQAKGAGMFGRWLWWLGGILIAAGGFILANIQDWMKA